MNFVLDERWAMNRYQFISMDRKRQLRILKVQGKVLHRKLKKGYTASVYKLENFYIEVWENMMIHKVINLVTHKDATLLGYVSRPDKSGKV